MSLAMPAPCAAPQAAGSASVPVPLLVPRALGAQEPLVVPSSGPVSPRPVPAANRSATEARRSGGEGEDDDQVTDVPMEERTTVMLRNLPNNYTQQMLLTMLDGEGFRGDYDFVYMPADFRTRAALGYAFVNFTSPAQVARFWQTFDGYTKWSIPSRKVCFVSWCGPHQGLEAHVARYRNSPVMHSAVPWEYKPLLFQDGVQVPFPAPTKKPRAPRIRDYERMPQ